MHAPSTERPRAQDELELGEQRQGATSERLLGAAATAVLAWTCLAAAVSILARWPYQFTGQGDPDRMLRDFLAFGTLLAPPLPLLLVFAAAALLVRREDRLGRVAGIVLIPAGAAMAVGSLGEALSPASTDVPRAIQLAGGILGAVLFATLAVLATGATLERRRGSRRRSER